MREPVAGWLGIDVGWVHPAVDSDGRIYTWANQRHRQDARSYCTTASEVTVTRPDGTTHTQPPYGEEQIAALLVCSEHEFQERCLRLASSIVAKAFRQSFGIAVESWDDRPDRSARWRIIHQAIISHAAQRDVPVIQVRRAYTSQTCPGCGHRSKDNRPTRDTFTCQRCGLAGQADEIAARNIAARADAARTPNPSTGAQEGQKRCTGCGIVKAHEDFHRNRNQPDGRAPRCKSCVAPARGGGCPAVTNRGTPCTARGATFYGGYCGRHKDRASAG